MTPNQPAAEPATNISSIGANEHGLNFLSESEVETKQTVDQAQHSGGRQVNEGSGFDAAPAGDGWDKHGGTEDNSGDAGRFAGFMGNVESRGNLYYFLNHCLEKVIQVDHWKSDLLCERSWVKIVIQILIHGKWIRDLAFFQQWISKIG